MDKQEQFRSYAERWERAAPRLDALRREALQQVDTARAIQILDDAYQCARRHARPRPWSGLVEWQRALAEIYK